MNRVYKAKKELVRKGRGVYKTRTERNSGVDILSVRERPNRGDTLSGAIFRKWSLCLESVWIFGIFV
jgi:hypothetical protein